VFGARPEVAAIVDARTTPHPTACFTQAMQHRSRQKENLHLRERSGADHLHALLEKVKNNKEWTVHTLPCTHIVQMDLPDELTALLLQAIP
jgi:hypothetical protein